MAAGLVGIVRKAQAVRAGTYGLDEFVAALQQATLYLQRPEQPGVYVAELDGGQRWVSVFSTPERMALFAGAAGWASMRGDDFLSQLPVGVNVVFDPAEPHSVALDSFQLPRPLPAPNR